MYDITTKPHAAADLAVRAKVVPLKPTPANAMVPVDNALFLKTIFGDRNRDAIITSFLDDPGAIPKDRRGICWAARSARRSSLIPKSNQYFCISLFKPLIREDGSSKPARRKSLFQAGYCIVVDDVKDKIPLTQAEKLPPPSWRLETSPGNEQWGYLFTEPETNRERLEALLDGLVSQGLAPDGKDPGMKGVTRYVRLPEGHNLKSKWLQSLGPEGWPCRMLEWQPERRYTPGQLAEAYRIDLPAETPGWVTATAQTADSEETIPQDIIGEHPVLLALGNRVLGPVEADNRVMIECPWIENHSDKDDSGTAVWLRLDGTAGYRCHHGHCTDRESLEFMGWCREQPGWEENLARWQRDVAQIAFAEATSMAAGVMGPSSDVAAVTPEVTGEAIEEVIGGTVGDVDDETRGAAEADKQNFRRAIKEVQAAMDRLRSGASKYLNVENCWRIWSRVGKTGGKERMVILEESGEISDFLTGRLLSQAIRRHGMIFDRGRIKAETAIVDDDLDDLHKLTHKLFQENLEGFRQFDSLRVSTDPFADSTSTVIVGRDLAVIGPLANTLKPRRKHGLSAEQAAAVVADYKEHFPELDDVVDWILAARLAASRRKASLYLQASSDWGKAFFWSGVLGDDGLRLVYSAPMEAIESAVSQRPSGLSAERLAKSMVLFTDEVKVVKREVKTLDSSIQFTPKFKSAVTVPLYAKVFCSAENIDSFIGDYGVEEQFLNRFCYIHGKGKLTERPLFVQVSKGVYRDVISEYVGRRMAAALERWRSEGREAAERWADGYLDTFHRKYSLREHGGSLDDTIKDIAEEIRQAWLVAAFGGHDPDIFLGDHPTFGTVVAVQKPLGKIKRFLRDGSILRDGEAIDRSESGKVMQKAGSIRDQLDIQEAYTNKAVAVHVEGKSERKIGKFLLFRPWG